ncbi:MAG: cysteine-rich CWC family protein [Anaerolineae bacterium]|nr:cysteine-rich CWC family protein [Anaerolineae bacterium]MDQ7034735.1 cysteine-rich CWC family protein [Anaerolineae bacterium]
MREANDNNNTSCSQCGVAFHCAYQADEKSCWCFHLAHMPYDDSVEGCLCPNCLSERINQQQQNETSK